MKSMRDEKLESLTEAQRVIMQQAVRLLQIEPNRELAECFGVVDSILEKRIKERHTEQMSA